MKEIKVLTRKGKVTIELSEIVKENFKGNVITYLQFYYLDYAVDENTGEISKTEKEKFFNDSQMNRNSKNFRNAYSIGFIEHHSGGKVITIENTKIQNIYTVLIQFEKGSVIDAQPLMDIEKIDFKNNTIKGIFAVYTTTSETPSTSNIQTVMA